MQSIVIGILIGMGISLLIFYCLKSDIKMIIDKFLILFMMVTLTCLSIIIVSLTYEIVSFLLNNNFLNLLTEGTEKR